MHSSDSHPSDTSQKNQRTFGRKAAEIQARRHAGLPVGPTTGALTEERRDALEAIDPSWCPAWPVTWQRCYRLCRTLITIDAPLPTQPGQTTLQGEDLGAWIQTQRHNWDQLQPAQQWMLEHMLHIGPAAPDERPQTPRTQADKWAANIRAASTNCTSLSVTSACSGVFVRSRRTVHVSRFGALKISIEAGGADRFQKVYMLRRYRLSPWSCL